MSTPLSRRTLLRGASGAALSLPFLEAGFARGQAMEFPKRLVVMFTPNGTLYDRWKPSGTSGNYTLQGILEPLAPHKSDVLLLDGIDMRSHALDPGRNGHDRGMGHLLTATSLKPGPQGVGEFGHLFDGGAGGPSFDQVIANTMSTRFKSLQVGVKVYFYQQQCINYMSWRGPRDPLPPENDVAALYGRLFGNGLPAPQVSLQQKKRRLTLDATYKDYQALQGKLGAEDKQRLDAHVSSLAELDRRIQQMPVTDCTRPVLGATSAFPDVGKAQMDLVTQALACDLTRVVTFEWTTAQGGNTFPWLGINDSHHGLSHEPDTNADAQDKLFKINRWYAEQYALLLTKLKAVKEGSGTLLDNTAVLWINELAKGNTHAFDNVPMVLGGKLGGALRPGRWLQLNGEKPHNDLFVALMQGFGLGVTTFGNPACCNGPLAGLS